jgi:hypothetical protein
MLLSLPYPLTLFFTFFFLNNWLQRASCCTLADNLELGSKFLAPLVHSIFIYHCTPSPPFTYFEYTVHISTQRNAYSHNGWKLVVLVL